jgi:hypothetical protein
MPQHAAADWNAADRAPEYPPGAGDKVSTSNHPATESATEARQGVTGHNVNIVLVVSTVAVVIAFAVIWAVFWA